MRLLRLQYVNNIINPIDSDSDTHYYYEIKGIAKIQLKN